MLICLRIKKQYAPIERRLGAPKRILLICGIFLRTFARNTDDMDDCYPRHLISVKDQVTWRCTRRFPTGDRRRSSVFIAPLSLPQERNPLRHEKSSRTGKKHTPKISIANRGYGEKSQIPLSSILPRKSAFEKPENSPNSLPSASWRIKTGLQKRIWHACSPADFIPPQSQWRCNCPLPRRSAAHWMRENAVWAALERKKACA